MPNRHNYILWLKHLLDSTSYGPAGGRLSGLDIGTGASCIYPLLGCVQRPWSFFATDVDDKSLTFARKNVELNGLQGRIKVVPRRPEEPLVPLDELGIDSLDFVMTNPPFYFSEDELLASALKKSRPPHSACTGAPVEMVCEGGEVAFVGRIVDESLRLRGRVRWYTSMLGKVSSLEVLVDQLRGHGVDNFAVNEFVQGSKTRRWAVGWSFGAMRPAHDVARGMKAVAWRKVLPAATEVELLAAPVDRVGWLARRADELMMGLDLISWDWDKDKLNGVGRASENVWGRAYRRRMQREQKQLERGDTHGDGEAARVARTPGGEAFSAFGFRIGIEVGRREAIANCRWMEGHDQATFESFCGFMKTRLKGEQ